MDINRELISDINNSLQHLLLGKPLAPVKATELPGADEGLLCMAEIVNTLCANMNEFSAFARQLAEGNLSATTPVRSNYLSGPLKELHSQLSAYVWSIEQLLKGRVVERMDYTGELSDALNALITRIDGKGEWAVSGEIPVNSRQYHQVITAVNHLHLGIVTSDETGAVIFTNRKARDLLGEIESFASECAAIASKEIARCIGNHLFNGGIMPAVTMFMNSATCRWYRVRTDHVFSPDGRKLYLHSIEDISEWKDNEHELHISATIDSLTGVYNRSYGMGQLEDILRTGAEVQNSCVAFIDIDGLKEINDAYGHHEGDYTITTVARVLSSKVRASDFVSRLGGDEFLIVFKECSAADAEQAIARMQERICEINESDSKPYRLAFSHGLVQIGDPFDISAQEIIMLADQKMYELKKKKAPRN
jgi:diguanylate cyclase (GGDEF)-like protein